MENRDQQNPSLRPIQDSGRQGDRNPRVFLEAKVIQASSQLNPGRDKFLTFPREPLPDKNLGQGNFPIALRFGARGKWTSNIEFLQDCVGENPPISHLSTFPSSEITDKLEYLPLQINGKISSSLYFLLLVLVKAPILPMIFRHYRQMFNWSLHQQVLRNNVGLEHKRQKQPQILRKVALVATSNFVSHPLLFQEFSTATTLLQLSILI